MQSRNPKVISINSIMRNPKLRRLLEDAYNSPPGSSKRAYANSVFGSVSKVAMKRFSGQGGASSQMTNSSDPWGKYAMPAVQPFQTPLRRLPKRYSGQGGGFPGVLPLVGKAVSSAFGSIGTGISNMATDVSGFAKNAFVPAANITGNVIGNYAENAFAPALVGGESSIVNPFTTKPFSSNTSAKISTAAKATAPQASPTKNPYAGTDMDKKLNDANAKIQNNTATDVDRKNVEYAKTKGWTPTGSTQQGAGAPQTPSDFAKSLGVGSSGLTPDGGSANVTATGMKPGDIKMSQDQKSYSYMNKDGTMHQGTSGDNYVDQTQSTPSSLSGTLGSTSDTSGTTGMDTSGTTQTGALNPTGLEAVQAIMGRDYGDNMGFEAMLPDLFNDPEARAYIESLNPGVPKELLWNGGNLAKQLADIKKKKMEEDGLNALLDKRKEMQDQGTSLVDTMSNYVRGRDEYFTHIDQMIQDAESKWLKNPLYGDPNEQKNHEKYMTYLNNLKGKQYKRYADALNDSVTQYQDQLDRIDSDYKAAVDKFNDEFASDQAITQESYTNTYNKLSGMYASIVEAAKASDEASGLDEETSDQYGKMITWLSEQRQPYGKEMDLKKGRDYVEQQNVDKATGELNKTSDFSRDVMTMFSQHYDQEAAVGALQGDLAFVSAALSRRPDSDSITTGDISRVKNANEVLNTLLKLDDKAQGTKISVKDPETGNMVEQPLNTLVLDAVIREALPGIVKSEQDLLTNYFTSQASSLKKFFEKVEAGVKENKSLKNWNGTRRSLTKEEAIKEGINAGLKYEAIDLILQGVTNVDDILGLDSLANKRVKDASDVALAGDVAFGVAKGQLGGLIGRYGSAQQNESTQ